jgi:hypothetical protein
MLHQRSACVFELGARCVIERQLLLTTNFTMAATRTQKQNGKIFNFKVVTNAKAQETCCHANYEKHRIRHVVSAPLRA